MKAHGMQFLPIIMIRHMFAPGELEAMGERIHMGRRGGAVLEVPVQRWNTGYHRGDVNNRHRKSLGKLPQNIDLRSTTLSLAPVRSVHQDIPKLALVERKIPRTNRLIIRYAFRLPAVDVPGNARF